MSVANHRHRTPGHHPSRASLRTFGLQSAPAYHNRRRDVAFQNPLRAGVRLQCNIEPASVSGNLLIVKLAKKGRRFVVFKNRTTYFVFIENDAHELVKICGQAMMGHLRRYERIAEPT